MENTTQKYREFFENARTSWKDHINTLADLHNFQKNNDKKIQEEVKKATAKNLKELKELTKSLSEVNNTAIKEFVNEVYQAVFVSRRARTIEIGKLTEGEMKDRTLCFGKDGFSYRDKYRVHAYALRPSEMFQMLKNDALRNEIISNLHSAKQYELAVKVNQFYKLIKDADVDFGITMDLNKPIFLPMNFERYVNDVSRFPSLASKIEIEASEEILSVTCISTEKRTMMGELLSSEEAEQDNNYERKEGMQKFTYSLHFSQEVKDEGVENLLVKLQLLENISFISANVNAKIQAYKDTFNKLKADAQKEFSRELLANMVS